MGTPNAGKYNIRQVVVADNPPEAVITTPEAFSLATPSVRLPLEGYANDDLGLARVELMQTVSGYRDRSRDLGPVAGEHKFTFKREISLRDLGVKPGQVLEFYVEARDYNPALTGVAVSDLVRVQIISDEDYAEMVRTQTTLEQFVARYETIEKKMEEMDKLLKQLKEAAESGDTKSMEALQKKLAKLSGETAKLFEKMAEDFKAYNVEKSLTQPLKDYADNLRNGAKLLAKAGMNPEEVAKAAQALREKLKPAAKNMESQVQDARLLAKIGEVMKQASIYQMIVARQKELVRRLSRFAGVSGQKDARLLGTLGREQEVTRKMLEQFVKELRESALKLPPDYEELLQSAFEFADGVERLGIPRVMKAAEKAAGDGNGRKAHREASHALELLEQLMTENSGKSFGGMCNGCKPKFSVPKNLQSSLQQLAQAISNRISSGSGSGNGMGYGGSGMGGVGNGMGGSGSFMPGQSFMNMHIYGPQRMNFTGMQSGVSGHGKGGKGGKGAGLQHVGDNARENLEVTRRQQTDGESMPLEDISEKYREAVKRYFAE
jgi:tetratricopeptide (TPR) repeat protein